MVGEKLKLAYIKKIITPVTFSLSWKADKITLLPLFLCFSAINSFIFTGILDSNFLTILHSVLINKAFEEHSKNRKWG